MPLNVVEIVISTLQLISAAVLVKFSENTLKTQYNVAEARSTTPTRRFAVTIGCRENGTSETPYVVAKEYTMTGQEDVQVGNQFVVETECFIQAE